jgi:hypothetical protein
MTSFEVFGNAVVLRLTSPVLQFLVMLSSLNSHRLRRCMRTEVRNRPSPAQTMIFSQTTRSILAQLFKSDHKSSVELHRLLDLADFYVFDCPMGAVYISWPTNNARNSGA